MLLEKQILNSPSAKNAVPIPLTRANSRSPLVPITPLESNINANAAKICRLEKTEFHFIQHFITEIKKEPSFSKDAPFRFDKKTYKLPRTVSYIPGEGFYILMKTKNKAPVIGVGAQKRVTLAYHCELEKVITCGSMLLENGLKQEIDIHQMLGSRKDMFVVGSTIEYNGSCNAARIKGTTFTKNTNVKKIAFFTEWLHLGSLSSINKEYWLKNNNQLSVAKRIVEIIHCLHSEYNLVHCDLKLDNFFMDESGTVKLGDFGFTEKNDTETPLKGSRLFLAPEQWSNLFNDAKNKAATASDIWSLGITLTELIHPGQWLLTRKVRNKDNKTGFTIQLDKKNVYILPMDQESIEESAMKILKFRDNKNHLDSLIDSCLQLDPQKRPSAKELCELSEKINQI